MVTITAPEKFTSTAHAEVEHTSAMIKDGEVKNVDVGTDINASKLGAGTVALARIPATLTGKDADTVDGVEGAVITGHHARHESGGADAIAAALALAAIPATLTGKDADTVDGVEGAVITGHHARHESGGADALAAAVALVAIPVLPGSKLDSSNLVVTSGGSDEQAAINSQDSLFTGMKIRTGQRKIISNKYVGKLGFWLRKNGSPTGDVTLTVRKVSDDSVILTKVWGQAEDLPAEATYEEVEFTTPLPVNEEVRLCAEYTGGDSSNSVLVSYNVTDVKADEFRSTYLASWTDEPDTDLAYKVTWIEMSLKLEATG